MVKTVFFGTQDFAASILEAIIVSGEYEITAVVTQPDRPVGRSQETSKSPVKLLAEEHRLNILQPESLKNYSLPPTPYSLNIVCQYGLIIPKSILETPKRSSINVHTSLLPKYRGASPIQSSLVNGETETGVTIMLMDEKMDHGPILAHEKINISADDTTEILSEKMKPVAANLLLKTVPEYLAGEIQPTPQDESQATFCKILSRDDGKVDWNNSTEQIYNQYRGLTPWPGIWTTWYNKRLKLLKITPSPSRRGTVGEVNVVDNRIFVHALDGLIEATELQLEGKKPMSSAEFLNGYQNFKDAKLL